ncbi:uncharacterized protein LOC129598893 [Paramacrobiotus metropolitanus]|uniref:uncharacterized protein LOC129598893 n=1 Tax=Paramacrobiotus metropolitanus TaxID=2943436 RepID=UPI00244627E3|nr:uncharacterized protein LOC129598893 [Paramacrobiotus metropolitanus]
MSWLNLKQYFIRDKSSRSSRNLPKSALHSNCTRSVTFVYQIPTSQFVGKRLRNWDVGYAGSDWVFSADFLVENQWNFPEIPQSMWTVRMVVDGDIVTDHSSLLFNDEYTPQAKVVPKKGYEGLASSGEIVVEGKVSATESDPSTCTTIAIGPDGWKHSAAVKEDIELAHLFCCKAVVDEKGVSRQYPALMDGTIYVRLTFHVQQHERHDLQRLLNSGLMTDCTLVATDGRKFPAHRAILAVQSPMLTEMLQNRKNEKIGGLFVAMDADGGLVEILVRFAYTRELLHTADGKLEELWMLAEKFEMKELCAACECRMMDGVDGGNAMRYYAFARKFGLVKLQQIVGKYIGKNPMGV